MKRKEVKKLIQFINKHRKQGMASFNITTNRDTLVVSTKEWGEYPKETIRITHKYFE